MRKDLSERTLFYERELIVMGFLERKRVLVMQFEAFFVWDFVLDSWVWHRDCNECILSVG